MIMVENSAFYYPPPLTNFTVNLMSKEKSTFNIHLLVSKCDTYQLVVSVSTRCDRTFRYVRMFT